MKTSKNNHFSEIVSIFQDFQLPEPEMRLAGYAAIIRVYQLEIPAPDLLAAISHKNKQYQAEPWLVFTPRHAPENTLYAQLVFALKYEGVNLSVLKALFDEISAKEIIDFVQAQPTSSYARRLWFLYEWLQQTSLDLPDASSGNFVDALDSKLQYPGPSINSKRHRVRNNLSGTPGFCPTIRKTETLDKFVAMNLAERAQKIIGAIHPDLLMRAAAFMLLKDSKASYAIEGETPQQTRAERWARAIGQAGIHPLSHDELLRLQEIVIADFRFVQYGYRNEGGFIGDHERGTGLPIPDHISASPENIFDLIDALIATEKKLRETDFDAVMAAAMVAFGFVFIHPFEDGNGRIHRYLIHHILAEKNFMPKQIIFPISAVILQHIEKYRSVLEAYSRPRLRFIKWRPTADGNVEVLNKPINLYRYFDATKQTEFLYDCILETIEKTLPDEVDYLKKYDEMKQFIKNTIEMPDKTIDLLIRFLSQEDGRLSKRARQKEFRDLTEAEIASLETKYSEIFLL